MKASEADILIVPGLGGSGPDHWQSRWERNLSTARRVEQTDWERPDPVEWPAALIAQAKSAERPVVIVAHSLGVLVCVNAARHLRGVVRGAFLVAPPDPAGAAFPEAASGFATVSTDPLPFPSFVIASRTDPYCLYETAGDMANAWGSLLLDAGDAGHINTVSGHGPWPEGTLVFARFLQHL
ncbi:RBBP9/YdeN family alpha/beta hydrolase [Propylenella binzhouense]|uniref:Serine hydrolase family protein n=1 Tax=Propylenella binzhouense TaxID=2555902 RepID=A0A964WTQ4_9HYPH|nr:alpha/beta hydrolase [Propylenella binzhouense]MYZ48080.1 serine hydrolase family protein [Propylenella binzhouense]